jgi:hypothetical protein
MTLKYAYMASHQRVRMNSELSCAEQVGVVELRHLNSEAALSLLARDLVASIRFIQVFLLYVGNLSDK